MTFYAIECMTSAQDTHYLRTKNGAWRGFADLAKARRCAAELQKTAGLTAAYRVVDLEVDNGELATVLFGHRGI